MAILLSVFLLLVVCLYGILSRKTAYVDFGVIIAYAVLSMAGIIFLSTEIMSLFCMLTTVKLYIMWICVLVILLGIVALQKNLRQIRIIKQKKIYNIAKSHGKILLFFIIAFGLMLTLSYSTVPYNYDSFTYHLPRIFYWSKNHSVEHFAASYNLQDIAPVFAEYIQLHVYLLESMSDRLLPVVQCIACMECAIFIYLITRKLGANKGWSTMAAVMFISTPIVFAESLTTQNDIITTALFLPSVYLSLFLADDIKDGTRENIFSLKTFYIGIGFGLTILAKEYAGLPILLICMWLMILVIRKRKIKLYFGKLFQIGLLATAVIIPERVRVYHTIGHFFASGLSSNQIVSTFDPRLLFICFLKNLFFNLPSHYIYKMKEFLESAIIKIADILQVSINDPRIAKQAYMLNLPFLYDHNSADNAIIIVFYIMSIFFALRIIVKKKKIKYAGYHISALLALTIFLTILMFTRNRTRYEIVFFAFLCPAVCTLLQSSVTKKVNGMIILSITAAFCMCEFVNSFVYHANQQVIYDGRKEPYSYFGSHTEIYENYKAIIQKIEEYGCFKVGNHIEAGVMEYPLLVMLSPYEINNINVDNETVRYENFDYVPDCLIYMGFLNHYQCGDIIECHGESYRVVYEQEILPDNFGLDAFAVKVKE